MKKPNTRRPLFQPAACLCALAALMQTAATARAAALDQWPLVLVRGGVTNTLYQPQLDSWDYSTLVAHSAVAVQPAGDPQPTFGVISLSAKTLVDRAQRMVSFENLQITQANFPSAPAQTGTWEASLQALLPQQIRSMALDRLEASLAILEARQKAEGLPLRNDPPVIILSIEPAMLVPVDGPPVYRPVDKLGLDRVCNTRALLLRDKGGTHYLHLFDDYVQAPDLGGPWFPTRKVSRDIKKAEKLAVDAKQVDLLAGQEDPETKKMPSLKSTPVPVLYLTTVPTELIVADGVPIWIPIPSTQLLYMTNTTAQVFKDLLDQQTYLLLSGRWFRAPSTDGPWEFVPGQNLPADFAQIPDDSPKENVKASVPGTRQAREAAIANAIPQSTKVDRTQAKMSPPPQYDRPIQLKPIDGTPLSYVFNSATPVIKVDDQTWYACQNGVWFTATSATGPWVVATSVPAVIYSIPVTSPLHYVTYVRIHSSDPDYVYLGSTPGYYGTVINESGTVVYGTGYLYPAYVGSDLYVPYPITYGYDCNPVWTPWAGWGFGFGAAWPLGPSSAYCPPAPYWGPYGAMCYGLHYNAYGGYAAWGPYGWAGSSGFIYHQGGPWAGASRASDGYDAWTGNAWASQYGRAYNSVTGNQVAGRRGAVDNVYTGNYAAGKKGVAYNNRTGTVAAGEKATVGNAYTGNSATAARGAVYNPRTGQDATFSGIKTSQGGVASIDGHTVASHDGYVFHSNGSGGWDQMNRSGQSSLSSSFGSGFEQQRSSFESEVSSRDWGAQRAQSFQFNRPSFGGGGFGGGGGRR